MKLLLKRKVFLILFIICYKTVTYSQKVYYNLNGRETIGEKNYLEQIKNLPNTVKLEIFELKTIKKQDSVIKYVKIQNLLTTPNGIDPWAEPKKNLGKKFPFEQFLITKTQKLSSDSLKGKPVLINFWFTKCAPCVKEIPLLNKLRETYGEKIHFLSITFESEKTVTNFLKKQPFHFYPITNSRKQINELHISNYPLSFIIDENGIIRAIIPMVADFNFEDIKFMLNILLYK